MGVSPMGAPGGASGAGMTRWVSAGRSRKRLMSAASCRCCACSDSPCGAAVRRRAASLSSLNAAMARTWPLGEPADLVRTATTIEQVRTEADEADGGLRWAAEATYEGSVRFSEHQLEEPSSLVPIFDDLTRWIASTLISLADLPFTFLPPGEDDA